MTFLTEVWEHVKPAWILRRQISDAQTRLNRLPEGDSLRGLYQATIARRSRILAFHPSQLFRRLTGR